MGGSWRFFPGWWPRAATYIRGVANQVPQPISARPQTTSRRRSLTYWLWNLLSHSLNIRCRTGPSAWEKSSTSLTVRVVVRITRQILEFLMECLSLQDRGNCANFACNYKSCQVNELLCFFCGGARWLTIKRAFCFGADPDHDPNLRIFDGIFTTAG